MMNAPTCCPMCWNSGTWTKLSMPIYGENSVEGISPDPTKTSPKQDVSAYHCGKCGYTRVYADKKSP